ncbi:unnamed protein product [Closterium sp. Naga37s-1]|nr:unnamed protein product [Closterium sp. Naga37s-1]
MPGMTVELNTNTGSSSANASDSAPSDIAPPTTAPPAPAPSPPVPDAPTANAVLNSPSVDRTPGPPPLRSHRQPTPDLLPPILPMSSRRVVTLLFPERGADVVRAPLISAIFTKLTPSLFNCGFISEARATNGETLRFAGRSYASICYFWPTLQSANVFHAVFRHPFEKSPGRSIRAKPYIDPHPDFTEAKASGSPILSLRRVPARFEDTDIFAYLVPRWLAGISLFHHMQDPYDGVFLPILTGIPIPQPDDPDFLSIPALLPTGGKSPAILVNVSTHECSKCASNHRVEDHAVFPCLRKGHLNNKAQITVAQLQKSYGGSLGARAAPTSVRADPGILLIGTDMSVEPWTCVLCDLVCGPTLDSALEQWPPHSTAHVLGNAHKPAAKETYDTWSAAAFLKDEKIAAFLKQMKLMSHVKVSHACCMCAAPL